VYSITNVFCKICWFYDIVHAKSTVVKVVTGSFFYDDQQQYV